MRTIEEARTDWADLHEMSPALRGFLSRRCRDENEIDDVVQETLLRAARRGDGQADVRSPRAWLFRIATNVLCDRARCDRHRLSVEADLDELAPPEPAPMELCESMIRVGERFVEHSTLLEWLPAGLAGLDEADRRVLECYYRDGLDCRQTAQRCGLTADLVKVRLFRARRRLGRALIRRSASS